MTRWKLLAAGIVAYALGLIALMPATLVDAALQRLSDGRLRLAEARGTFWSGAGQIEIRDVRQRTGVSKPVAWRFVPTSLLRGHLVCEVEFDQRPFPVTISLSRVEVTHADIQLPAAVLGLTVPSLAPLELGGDLSLQVAKLTIDRNRIHGDATVQWRAASSALTPVSPLGSYELRVQDAGTGLRSSLRTLQGPLQLDGQGSWTNGSKPVLQATARVPPPHEQQLAPLLRLIGVERGGGTFELAFMTPR